MIAAFPPDLEAFVSNELAVGRYASKDELLCEAVRVLRDRESRRQELKRRIQTGIEQIDQGEGINLDSPEALNAFFDDIQARGWQRSHGQRSQQ